MNTGGGNTQFGWVKLSFQNGGGGYPDKIKLFSYAFNNATAANDDVLNALVGIVSAVNAGVSAATSRGAFRLADAAPPEACGSIGSSRSRSAGDEGDIASWRRRWRSPSVSRASRTLDGAVKIAGAPTK